MTTISRVKRVAIVGSRDWPHPKTVEGFVLGLVEIDGRGAFEVVTGGARGVDTIAEETARGEGVSVKVLPADWDKWGKHAGYLRNREIIAYADSVVAFWDGKSKGTKHSIDLALQYGKDLQVVFP